MCLYLSITTPAAPSKCLVVALSRLKEKRRSADPWTVAVLSAVLVVLTLCVFCACVDYAPRSASMPTTKRHKNDVM